jgi:glycerol-3-phosphate acyltransferase PlsY
MPVDFIAVVCGYLLGSIPSAYIAGRLKKNIDIREVGSKNMGMLNVLYEVGPKEAVLVLLADASKGIAAILIARWLGVPLVFQLLTGAAAVVGHAFPVFLRFRGGTGGATTVGILLFLIPKAVPFFIAVAAIGLIITRNPMFCYSIALVVLPFVAWLIYHSVPLTAFSVGLPVFVGINYIPRFKRMHAAAHGNWRRIIMRKSLKERL